MFERDRHKNQPGPHARSSTHGDPWRSAGEARSNDQGVWILSYLDIMMILFAFFVLLFAYQKSLMPSAARLQKNVTAAVMSPAQHAIEPKPAAAQEAVAASAMQEPTSLAVSAMKSQAPAFRVSRDPGKTESREHDADALPAARPTADVLAGTARLAAVQGAPSVSQALLKAMEGKPVEVVSAGKEVRLEVSEAILFQPASADLNPDGGGLMDKVLPILRQQRGIVFVEGHTDNKPIANSRYPSNWELSTARATAVTRYLIGKGIASDRLRAVGLADTHPRAGNDSVEGRARNRRVSLVLGVDQPSS